MTILMSVLFAVTAAAVTPEKMPVKGRISKAEMEQKVQQVTGGRLLVPGTATGSVKIFNCQKKVSTLELKQTVDKNALLLKINLTIADHAPVAWTDALRVREQEKANIAVFIVDDPSLPVSLVAQEERWGFVNIAKLFGESEDQVIRFGRTRSELIRILAFVCGSSESQYPGNVLAAKDRPQDLDGLEPGIPIDALNRIADALKRHGVVPAKYTTYRNACVEGWAAAPTNEFQKAIWDKVHEMPQNPIKILPETKPVAK